MKSFQRDRHTTDLSRLEAEVVLRNSMTSPFVSRSSITWARDVYMYTLDFLQVRFRCFIKEVEVDLWQV